VNDETGQPVQVLKAGQDLPVTKEHSQETVLKRDILYYRKFDVVFDVFTGSTLASAKHRRLKIKKDEDSSFGKWIRFFNCLELPFMKMNWPFTLNAIFKVNNDGTLYIQGDILVDHRETDASHFTLNDLEEV
jgi:hypothetical protein